MRVCESESEWLDNIPLWGVSSFLKEGNVFSVVMVTQGLVVKLASNYLCERARKKESLRVLQYLEGRPLRAIRKRAISFLLRGEELEESFT